MDRVPKALWGTMETRWAQYLIEGTTSRPKRAEEEPEGGGAKRGKSAASGDWAGFRT